MAASISRSFSSPTLSSGYGRCGGSGMGGRGGGRVVATLGTGDHNSFLGYAIAIMTLGAAIGNMFLAGKIRNLMKMKVPTPANWKNNSGPGNAGNAGNAGSAGNAGNAGKAGADVRAQQQAQAEAKLRAFREMLRASTISPEIERSLSVLELPSGSAPSSGELKEAYRVACLKYHPDRNREQSIELQRVTAERFKQSQEAYQALQAFLQRGGDADA
jgi:hypothetical protein